MTIAQIARQLRLGKATVCRALTNTGSVSAKTRQRIEEAARRMGYRPDPALSALAHRRWNRRPSQNIPLAFLYPAGEDVFSKACWNSIRHHATAAGYSIEPHFIRDFTSPSHASRVLYHRGIRGIIVAHQPRHSPPLAMDWSRFAVVSCGLRADQFPSAIVMPNVFNGMKLCFRAARDAGFKRIGMAFMDEGPDDNTEYQTGAFLAELYPRRILPPLTDLNQFELWFKKHQPEVILGSNLELYDALLAKGWRFPRDTSFICFGWNNRLGTVAGLDLHTDLIGRSALDLLDVQLRLTRREPLEGNKITHMIEPSWVPGKTAIT